MNCKFILQKIVKIYIRLLDATCIHFDDAIFITNSMLHKYYAWWNCTDNLHIRCICKSQGFLQFPKTAGELRHTVSGVLGILSRVNDCVRAYILSLTVNHSDLHYCKLRLLDIYYLPQLSIIPTCVNRSSAFSLLWSSTKHSNNVNWHDVMSHDMTSFCTI